MKVHVDREVCKGCGLCVAFCPAGVFRIGAETNKKGYAFVVAQDETKCVGCGRCEAGCPDLALYIER